jgi:hypothetical protein
MGRFGQGEQGRGGVPRRACSKGKRGKENRKRKIGKERKRKEEGFRKLG